MLVNSFFAVQTLVDPNIFLPLDSPTVTLQSEQDMFMTVSGDVFVNGLSQDSRDFSLAKLGQELHLNPIGILVIGSIQNVALPQPLRALFDSGSDKTFLSSQVLPKGIKGAPTASHSFNTINGLKTISQEVSISQITLPEFSPTKRIDQTVSALVTDTGKSNYDHSWLGFHGSSWNKYPLLYQDHLLGWYCGSLATQLHFFFKQPVCVPFVSGF